MTRSDETAAIPFRLYPQALRLWYLRREVRALRAFHAHGGLDHGPSGALQYDFAHPLLYVFLLKLIAELTSAQLHLELDRWIDAATLLLALPAVYVGILLFEWGRKSRAALGFEMRHLFMGKPDAVAAKLVLAEREDELRALVV